MPKARRERGLRAITAARKALAAQAVADNDPRRNTALTAREMRRSARGIAAIAAGRASTSGVGNALVASIAYAER
jgi:hypothetical protein